MFDTVSKIFGRALGLAVKKIRYCRYGIELISLIGVKLQLHGFYSRTHRPCFFISSYIASGARSISPGHTTAPYST